MSDLLLRHARIFSGDPRRAVLEDHAVLTAQGRIVYCGPDGELNADIARHAREEVDAGDALVTPGLVDCHTHLIFGGRRAEEFELRLAGTPYHEIAERGGGIASTVRATRAASDESLLADAKGRLDRMAAQGITTVEIKSGYGLNRKEELRLLRLVQELQKQTAQTLVPTLLGAHAIGPEFGDDRAAYLSEICEGMIPEAAAQRLARAVDVFTEQGAFTVEETHRIFRVARGHGLRVKCHAEQFTASGAAELAARHGALSADHLEYLTPRSAEALARSGTVAVLLPGAMLALALPHPPIAALRESGAMIAIATDANPGSSMTTDLLLMMQLAAVLWRLSPAECLAGATFHAAHALGLAQSHGRVAAGYDADLVLWDAKDPVDLVYELGGNPLRRCWKRGRPLR